jgi:hypothetical protein
MHNSREYLRHLLLSGWASFVICFPMGLLSALQVQMCIERVDMRNVCVSDTRLTWLLVAD